MQDVSDTQGKPMVSGRPTHRLLIAESAGRAERDAVEATTPGIRELLMRVESMLCEFLKYQSPREWYSTDQFAKEVGLAEVTVRGHCRLGRLNAEKQKSGRGAHAAWVLSRVELLRYQREGLLPTRCIIPIPTKGGGSEF